MRLMPYTIKRGHDRHSSHSKQTMTTKHKPVIRKHIYTLCLTTALLTACSSEAILDGGKTDTGGEVATNLPISFGTRLAATQAKATRATAATAYAGEWRATKALYGKTRKYANGGKDICAYGDTIINNEALMVYAIDSCRHGTLPANFCGVQMSNYIDVRAKGSTLNGGTPFDIQAKNNGYRSPLKVEAKKDVTLTALFRRQTFSTSDNQFAYACNDYKDLKMRDISPATTADGIATGVTTGGDTAKYDALYMESTLMYTPGTDLQRVGSDIYAYAMKTFNLKANHTYMLYATRTTIRLYGLEYSTGNSSNNILPGGTQAGVFAYHTSDDWTENSSADFMYNQPMDVKTPTTRTTTTTAADGTTTTTTSSVNTMDYSPMRYWPNDGSKLSFWAYYPWNATAANNDLDGDNGININATSIGNNMGMGSIKFTMQQDSREQVDFMVADLVANKTKADAQPASASEAPNPVQFTFHHALSQIRIYINEKLGDTETNEWDEATLNTRVELSNIGTQATLTPQETYPDNNYRSWGWSTVPLSETGTATDPTQTGTALIEAYQTATLEFTETTIDGKTKSVPNTAIGFPPVNTLYVIPQVINGGTSGTSPLIKVTVNDKNNKPATLTAYLSDITWLPNHIYTYCITIDLSPGQEEHEYGLKGGVLWYADHQTETGFDVGGDETYDDDTPVGAAKRKRWQK